MDVLLATGLKDTVEQLGLFGAWRSIVLTDDIAIIAALGMFYGILGLVTGLYVTIRYIRRQEVSRNLAIVGGISAAYMLTLATRYLFGAEHTRQALTGALLGFNYVILLHLVLWTLESLIPMPGRQEKYAYFVGGLQALGATWILARAFGDASPMLSGGLFFGFFLLTASGYELVGRPLEHLEATLSEKPPIDMQLLRERLRSTVFRWALALTTLGWAAFPILSLWAARWILTSL